MNEHMNPASNAFRPDWIELLEEEMECGLSDWFDQLSLDGTYKNERIDYFINLLKLQRELIKLQNWIAHTDQRLVVLFEGRDAAGKGGVIKRISQRLNPRICRVAALPIPSQREQSQWYFQRYIAHLPAAGEMVLFDRSWYNRAGVEKVMGYCSHDEYEEFLFSAPEFEKMLIRSGIQLIKYWFSVTDKEQHHRFVQRMNDPLKQWKLSPVDIASRNHWKEYTQAKEVMFERTHIPESPWWIVNATDKQKARLNCISHLLSQVDYQDVSQKPIYLPDGDGACNETSTISRAMHVPDRY